MVHLISQLIITTAALAVAGCSVSIANPNLPEGITRTIVTDPQMQKEGLIVEHLKFESTWDQTSPLYAYVVYPKNGTDLPIIFNTPGYNETSAPYRVNLNNYLASQGWLMVWVDMRGRGGSAGKHDSGGVEIHDIYDAVQAVKMAYSDIIDIDRIGFQGESGGGGNAISCMVKLPDTFCVGASFFGMHDYAKWQEIINKSNPSDGGGPANVLGTTYEQAPDRYMARNSTIAAANNPYSKIFQFNDEEEITCWPVMDRAFKKTADAAGLTNVTLSISDSESPIRTRHRSSTAELVQTRKIYLEPLKNGEYHLPKIKNKAEFIILGFIITEKFAIYCGDGQNAVARVKYHLKKNSLTFKTTPLTSDPNKTITFKLPKTEYIKVIYAEVNNKKIPINDEKDHFVFIAPTLQNTVKVKVIRQ